MEDLAPVNPFRDTPAGERVPEPATMVIFGATGDLTRGKLFPALWQLLAAGQLALPFCVVGFARRPWTDREFRRQLKSSLTEHLPGGAPPDAVWRELAPSFHYLRADFDEPAGYRKLKTLLAGLAKGNGAGRNVIFYLATPPSAGTAIVENLGRAGLARSERGWTRIIVEKPFGHDLDSARDLNRRLLRVFHEEQIYRIDHYLGKETVQNLLVFRFANGIFEPLWNRRYIDNVQITVAEPIGVAGRGEYFEEAGILRDMVQNHLMQLVSLFAMEPPASFRPEAVRDEKVKVLQSLRPMTVEDAARGSVRGQYGHGLVDGREVPGYREEPQVAPDSPVETYAALRLFIDNWRWADVPFYLRVGKRLPKRGTVISIQFRAVPHLLFQAAGGRLEPNVLTIRIQPEEGVSLQFCSKVPGPHITIRPVKMDFSYGTSFGALIPDAYVRLLLDCVTGDSTLFTRRDEIEAAWSWVTGVMEAWRLLPGPAFPNYEAGTWGPREAEDLMAREGRRWRHL